MAFLMGLLLAIVLLGVMGIIAVPAGIAKLFQKHQDKKREERVRKPSETFFCYNCGTENQGDAKYCKNCGSSLTEEIDKCPNCGAELESDSTFCVECGSSLSESMRKEEESPSSTKLKVVAVLSIIPGLGLLVSPFAFLSGYFRRRNDNPTYWLFKLGLVGIIMNWGVVLVAVILGGFGLI